MSNKWSFCCFTVCYGIFCSIIAWTNVFLLAHHSSRCDGGSKMFREQQGLWYKSVLWDKVPASCPALHHWHYSSAQGLSLFLQNVHTGQTNKLHRTCFCLFRIDPFSKTISRTDRECNRRKASAKKDSHQDTMLLLMILLLLRLSFQVFK